MNIYLPWWGWIAVALTAIFSWLIAYGCGYANGERAGILYMKLDAIGAGVAKACDFGGGWRWWTKEELGEKYSNYITATKETA